MKKYILLLLCVLFSSHTYAVCDGSAETLALKDPVTSGEYNVTTRLYRPLAIPGTQFPVVFILPPIVGETPLDGALALSMCLNGLGAYVVDVLNNPPEDVQVTNLNTHEDALIRAELAISSLISKLTADPEVSGRFGILGASQGGIFSAYLAGALPEIEASVLIAASGNIARVLAFSDQESVKKLRDARIDQFNLAGQTEYENFIRPFITRDPLVVANNIKADSSMIFIITLDTDVPTRNQRQLANQIQNPQVREIRNIHVPGIIQATTLFADDMINFLKVRLQ